MKNTIYLASSSASRKMLLEQSGYSFILVFQDADESVIDTSIGLEKTVTALCELKMEHVSMPQGKQGDIAFVLTADTLGYSSYGDILQKPKSRQEAAKMLRDYRCGSDVGTAFCLHKKEYKDGIWHTLESVTVYDQSECVFDVPEEFLDWYLDQVPFLSVSGAVQIEKFGEQFVKAIKGSYSTIVGLPMFKLREELYKMGFFDL